MDALTSHFTMQESAWEKRNQKHKHCFVCSVDYSLSWQYAPQPLPPQRAGPVARLRRAANNNEDSEAARTEKRKAREKLEGLHMRPEVTAIDNLAVVHSDGDYNIMPDPAHIVEGGVAKGIAECVKGACDDAAACGHAHGIAKTAAVIDDVVKAAGGPSHW